MKVVHGPFLWRGDEMAGRDDWIVTLRASECNEFYDAAQSLQGRSLRTIGKADFKVPRAVEKLAALAEWQNFAA